MNNSQKTLLEYEIESRTIHCFPGNCSNELDSTITMKKGEMKLRLMISFVVLSEIGNFHPCNSKIDLFLSEPLTHSLSSFFHAHLLKSAS